MTVGWHVYFLLCEGFNLFSDDIYTSVIRGIQLESHTAIIFAVKLSCDSYHARGLSSAWWTVEEQMGHLFTGYELFDSGNYLVVRDY